AAYLFATPAESQEITVNQSAGIEFEENDGFGYTLSPDDENYKPLPPAPAAPAKKGVPGKINPSDKTSTSYPRAMPEFPELFKEESPSAPAPKAATPVAKPKTVLKKADIKSSKKMYRYENGRPALPKTAATDEPRDETVEPEEATKAAPSPGKAETTPEEEAPGEQAEGVEEAASEPPPEPAFPPTSKHNRGQRKPAEPGKIRITGNLELGYQTASASGYEIGFLSQNGLLYFNDDFQQKTRLMVDGLFQNGLSVSGLFVENPFQDKQFNLNLSGPHGHANMGDVDAAFKAGQMTGFQKTIRGLDFAYNTGKLTFTGLLSRQKSETTHETFRGQNIRGPYVLRATSILRDSEVVTINGRQVPKNEYVLDYFLGQITFNSNIDPTSVVDITYESVLLVSINTGSLNGFSVNTDPKNRRYDIGAAYLEEGTSRATRETLFETSTDIDGLSAASGTAHNLGHIKLVKESEIVSRISGLQSELLSRDRDYTIDYPAGLISFLRTFSASDTIRVSFSYYNQNYLQWVSREELRGTARSSYILQKEKVYSGSEVVELYINDTYVRRLTRDVDYTISEANNSIDFLDSGVRPESTQARYVLISYEIVPANVPGSRDVKRKVTDFTARVTLGPATLRAEVSSTDSDITLKTVQILEERVATVGAATTDGVFPLQFEAIRGTEEVFFN
ncbi:MAG TPA: hypothetical protein PLQ76_07675, partial [bacterium]|nr:hypothetical protein [bacterium]